MSKEKRKEVARKTLDFINKNKKTFKKTSSCFYPNLPPVPESYNKLFGETIIEITPEDSLDAARRLLEEDCDHVLVLNMASDKNVGGGFLNGARAQEEEICRRTNLHPELKSQHHHYTLPEFGCIYSSNIIVFREGPPKYILLDTTCGGMHNNYKINVISASAYRHPPQTADGKLDGKYREGMIRKIQTLLNVAIIHNQHNLVLSAWGCGAFGNPAKDVAIIFKEIISSKRYNGYFNKIVFGVYDYNSNNYKKFVEVWKGDKCVITQ